MRAALEHLARYADFGLASVEALVLAPAAWILRDAAGLLRVGWMTVRLHSHTLPIMS